MSEFIITAVLTARVNTPQETCEALEAIMSHIPKAQLLVRLHDLITSHEALGMVNWTTTRGTARAQKLPLINLQEPEL